MKYIIVKTDLFINNKLYSEGSEIDLTKEQSKGIEEFLQPCHPERSEESDLKSHPEQIYAEHSRSSEGSQIVVAKNKMKRNKK